jgi:tetratricopeptide (TPR) repeat protein
MKFSNNYIFYPDNRALEKAIVYSISLLSAELAEDARLDDKVTVPDNFLHTRGNFEQHRFSSNILDSAREALEAALTEEYREQDPTGWAAAQNSLGNILGALGQQQRDVDLFEMAIGCFNKALEEFNQEKFPLDWAATQYNLGTATQALGRQESDSKLLKASVDAYTNALLEWTREQMPLEWASTMHQLGATFHAYGKLLKGNRQFQKSVVAYKNALAELDADDSALELAATHNNRGAVLHHLGESEENSGRLEEAIRSYETALTICMEQQLPIHLAVLCRVNKSTVRGVLAELTRDAVLAEETADDFEIMIELFHSSLQPLCLKHCEEQLNKAQSMVEEFSSLSD